ncbi:MAG TPA: VRR-NUC domain-containing protein, partial [Phenylobacterium sp.]|nr:VRR-NUC domain-containing protein [Phenylobacterium sp.]
ERALHMSVAAFLNRAWPEGLPWTHFPAGEVRDKATAGKLKGMGLKPGWPDFIFVLPNAQFAALELKAPGGTLSDPQKEVRDRLLACGCGYATARTPEEVEAVLARWLAAYGLKLRASIQLRAA